LTTHFVDERVGAGDAKKGLDRGCGVRAGRGDGFEGGKLRSNAADETGPFNDILGDNICPAKQHVGYVGGQAGPEFGVPYFGQAAEGESKQFDRSDGGWGAFGGREEGIQRDSSERVEVEGDDRIRLFLG